MRVRLYDQASGQLLCESTDGVAASLRHGDNVTFHDERARRVDCDPVVRRGIVVDRRPSLVNETVDICIRLADTP